MVFIFLFIIIQLLLIFYLIGFFFAFALSLFVESRRSNKAKYQIILISLCNGFLSWRYIAYIKKVK